jgi:hypothetical protein
VFVHFFVYASISQVFKLYFSFYIFVFVHYVCIFCLYVFYLCTFFIKKLRLHFTLCLCMCVCANCVCSFCFTLYRSLQFLFWALGVTYVWRFIIRDLKFFTFSLKNSCMGGEKYQTNIIKLQLFFSNFNPLNLNLC